MLLWMLACDAPCQAPPDGTLPGTIWGGPPSYRITLGEDGSARIDLPYAVGEVARAEAYDGKVEWTWSIYQDDTGEQTQSDGEGRLSGTVCGDVLEGELTDRGPATAVRFVRGQETDLEHYD